MAVYAKLLWLQAKKTRDPDGADEIQLSRGGRTFEEFTLREDAVYSFDERFLSFSGGNAVEVVAWELDRGGSNSRQIGSAVITDDAAGHGDKTATIRGHGAEYELWYRVI